MNLTQIQVYSGPLRRARVTDRAWKVSLEPRLLRSRRLAGTPFPGVDPNQQTTITGSDDYDYGNPGDHTT